MYLEMEIMQPVFELQANKAKTKGFPRGCIRGTVQVI